MNFNTLNTATLNGSSGVLPPAYLGLYRKTVRLITGQAVENAEVTIQRADGSAVVVWDGLTDPQPLDQPLLTDSTGTFSFYAGYGAYRITVSTAETTRVLENQVIGPSAVYVDDKDSGLKGQLDSAVATLDERIDTVVAPVGATALYVDGTAPADWALTGTIIPAADAPALTPLLPPFEPSLKLTGTAAAPFLVQLEMDSNTHVTKRDGYSVASFEPGNPFGFAAVMYPTVPAAAADTADLLWQQAPGEITDEGVVVRAPFELTTAAESAWAGSVAKTRSDLYVPYLRNAAPYLGLMYLDVRNTTLGPVTGARVPTLLTPTEDASAPTDSPVEASMAALTPDITGAGTEDSPVFVTAVYATTDPAASETVVHVHAYINGLVEQTHRIAGTAAPDSVSVASDQRQLNRTMAAVTTAGTTTLYYYNYTNANSSDDTATLTVEPGTPAFVSEFGRLLAYIPPGGLGTMELRVVTGNQGTIAIGTSADASLDLAGNLPAAPTAIKRIFVVEAPVAEPDNRLYAGAVAVSGGVDYLVGFYWDGAQFVLDQARPLADIQLELPYPQTGGTQPVEEVTDVTNAYALQAIGDNWYPVLSLDGLIQAPPDFGGGLVNTVVLYGPVQRIPGSDELLLPEYPAAVSADSTIKPYIKYK